MVRASRGDGRHVMEASAELLALAPHAVTSKVPAAAAAANQDRLRARGFIIVTRFPSDPPRPIPARQLKAAPRIDSRTGYAPPQAAVEPLPCAA